MRATRAFVGAFGAGISLAMAASFALLLVSSVVAFRGWPDDLAGSAEPETAALSAAGSARSSERAARVALPAPVPTTGSRARRTAAGAAVAVAVEIPTGTRRPASEAPVADAPAGGAAPSVAPPSPVAPDAPVVRLPDAVKTTADALRDTTGAVTDTTAPVAGEVPDVAGAVGRAGSLLP